MTWNTMKLPIWVKVGIHIKNNEGIIATQISKDLDITWTTSTMIVSGMEAKNFVVKKKTGRKKEISINPEYEVLFNELEKAFQKDLNVEKVV